MSHNLFSWNVNGVRSVHKKGFLNWLTSSEADFICVQEVKATPEQLEPELLAPKGYQSFWNPAQKAGYSGVAIYTRHEPDAVVTQMGVPEIDAEGRFLRLDFKNWSLLNTYFPNSQRDHKRLPYKLQFCAAMLNYMEELKKAGRHVILCGDLNIAHREIDLRNPKQNQDNAGFLPQERAWMDEFLQTGYVDVFREFEKGEGHYTWWSYRPGVREKNIGWRLDYFCTNREFLEAVRGSRIHPHVQGSDHCPVELILK